MVVGVVVVVVEGVGVAAGLEVVGVGVGVLEGLGVVVLGLGAVVVVGVGAAVVVGVVVAGASASGSAAGRDRQVGPPHLAGLHHAGSGCSCSQAAAAAAAAAAIPTCGRCRRCRGFGCRRRPGPGRRPGRRHGLEGVGGADAVQQLQRHQGGQVVAAQQRVIVRLAHAEVDAPERQAVGRHPRSRSATCQGEGQFAKPPPRSGSLGAATCCSAQRPTQAGATRRPGGCGAHLLDSLPANLMQVARGTSLTQHSSIFTAQMPWPGLSGEITPAGDSTGAAVVVVAGWPWGA